MENIFEYEGLKFLAERDIDSEYFPSFSYPAIIAYVTGYSRIDLHKADLLLGDNTIFYNDTDSIITSNLDYDKVLQCGIELGNWEVKFFGNVELKGLKYYCYKKIGEEHWRYKIKGVSSKYQPVFWHTEKIFVKKPRHYRTAIRENKKVNEWITVMYTRGNVQPKRFFYDNGLSRPFNDDDFR